MSEMAAVRLRASAPLTFGVPSGRVHSPLVEVELAGLRTKLVVDTGATSHVLTTAFSDVAQLARRPAPDGTDVSGASIPSWAVDNQVTIIEETEFVLEHLVAIEGPEPFPAWGIGGFLSPQALSPSETVIVDLTTPELLVVEGDLDSVRLWFEARYAPSARADGVRHSNGCLTVAASTAPTGPVVALIDSGAPTTEFQTATGGDATVEVGSARFAVPNMAPCGDLPVPEGMAPVDAPVGLVGMDLLAGTVLAIPPASSSVVWWSVLVR